MRLTLRKRRYGSNMYKILLQMEKEGMAIQQELETEVHVAIHDAEIWELLNHSKICSP